MITQSPSGGSQPSPHLPYNCISCGSPTQKWNVCDNCWDEVPKHLKKQFVPVEAAAANEKIERGGEYLLDGSQKVWVEEILDNGLIEVSYGSSRRTVSPGRLSSFVTPLQDTDKGIGFYCHEREVPTCATQCMDCEVWNALVDEKCNPTIEQMKKTIKVILKGYEQLKKAAAKGQEAKAIAEKVKRIRQMIYERAGITIDAEVATTLQDLLHDVISDLSQFSSPSSPENKNV